MSRSASSKKPALKAKPSVIASTRLKRGHLLIFAVIILVIAGCITVGFHFMRSTPPATSTAGPVSRQVLLAAEGDIKVTRPGPTLGGLDYAYIATVYDETLRASNQSEAVFASEQMMNSLFPGRTTNIHNELRSIVSKNSLKELSSTSQLGTESQAILNRYQQRYTTDGHALAWNGIIPQGPDNWRQTTGPPITPRAGDWQRWVVSQPITVVAPPVMGSAVDKQQLAIVEQTVAGRTGQDINLINFWAGQPGSETPGGIWQNVMFTKVQPNLSSQSKAADTQYAHLQSVLAQTISDAFMECWKVKYTYWTARPDMRIPGIPTAMSDPTFPGYISGHSTISKAAADVLSVMVPGYSKTWEADADQARYSRLVAGIHFDIDNQEGYVVGSNVAQQVVTSLRLQKVL